MIIIVAEDDKQAFSLALDELVREFPYLSYKDLEVKLLSDDLSKPYINTNIYG